MHCRIRSILWAIVAGCLIVRPSLAADEVFEKLSNVVYVERDGEKLLADVYVPDGDGPFPGVLMVHGGAWRVGSRLHMVGPSRNLARNGYTVVNISYRLAPAHKFPAQIEDCWAAVRWMRLNAKKYKIDPKRIAGYGYSAGAHLVSLLGVTDPPDNLRGDDEGDKVSLRLQAVVAGGTPCDFQQLRADNKILAYFLGGTRAEKPDVYHRASPIAFVSKDDPPIFFFHGEKDRLVPRANVDRMKKLLEEADVKTRLHIVAGKEHIGTFLDREARDKATAFLNEVLKPN